MTHSKTFQKPVSITQTIKPKATKQFMDQFLYNQLKNIMSRYYHSYDSETDLLLDMLRRMNQQYWPHQDQIAIKRQE